LIEEELPAARGEGAMDDIPEDVAAYIKSHDIQLDPRNPLQLRILRLRMRIEAKEGKPRELSAWEQERLTWSMPFSRLITRYDFPPPKEQE
jgi:hypothetical protein